MKFPSGDRNHAAKLGIMLLLVAGLASSTSAIDVSSCQDLQDINNGLSGSYTITQNIDCSGTSFQAIGSSSNPFTGSLNGDGYTVSNLKIQSYNDNAGFIESTNPATVEDITFDSFNLTYSGTNYAGLVGRCRGGSSLRDITVKNSVLYNKNTGGGSSLGAITGFTNDCDIDRVIVKNTDVFQEYIGAMGSVVGALNSGSLDKAFVQNVELYQGYSGDIGGRRAELGGVTGDAGTTIKDVRVDNISIDYNETYLQNEWGGPNDAYIGYIGGDDYQATYEDIFITSYSAGDTVNKLVGRNAGSTSLIDLYFDSNKVSVPSPDSGVTGLTTSGMQGSSASTNMNLDFSTVWSTKSNDYPALLFTLEPQATLNHPLDGEKIDKGVSEYFNYSVNSGGSSADVDLEITYPNGTTVTEFEDSLSSGTSKSYSQQYSFQDKGTYSWYVEINDGSQSSATWNFEVIDYSAATKTLNQPADGGVIKDYDSDYTANFNADINADVSGTYYIQSKLSTESNWQTVSSGSYSTGSNTITSSKSYTFQSDPETREWRVKTSDKFGNSTSGVNSFTAKQIDLPTVDISTSPLVSNWVDGDLKTTVSGDINTNAVDKIDIQYIFYNSGTGIQQYVRSQSVSAPNLDQQDSSTYSHTFSLPYEQFFEQQDVEIVASVTDTDGFTNTTSVGGLNDPDYVTPQAYPFLSGDAIEPSIENIQPGEYFNISIQGSVGADPIDTVTYSLDVTNNPNPSDVVKSPDFQDQNRFEDSKKKAFQMKKSWQGETITIQSAVTDQDGRTDTKSTSADTATPPDSFIQNSPNDNQVFLIPQGNSDTPVDIGWGVNTADNAGTAEMVVNGNVKDSFSINADSENTKTYSADYSEGTYDWKVRFTDSTDNSVYESGNKSFEVTDEPINLNLLNPSDGADVSMGNATQVSIDHDFEIDARALNENHYYKFSLNNTDSNTNVVARTSGDRNTGVNTRTESVSGLGEGNYSWSVKVYRSSDDTILESKTSSYTLERKPKFKQDVFSPSDGGTVVLSPNQTSKVVNTYFEIESFATDVNTNVKLDGSQVNSVTTPSGSYRSYNIQLGNLSAGDYTYTVKSTDGSGRTTTTQRSFEVVESAKKEVRITELSTDPKIENWQVGDNVTVYFETTGDLPDVQYFQLDITADGQVVDTIFLPREDLKEGSVFGTASFIVTQQLVDAAIKIGGEVLTSAGDTLTTFLSGSGGGSRQPSVSIVDPTRGEPLYHPSAQDTRFAFDVFTVNNPVSWTVEARNQDESDWKLIGVSSNDVQAQDGPKQEEFFVNLNKSFAGGSGTFDKYYTDYTWRVNITEGNTGYDKSFYSDFSISKNDNASLYWSNPTEGDVIPINQGDTKSVPFQWRLERSGGSGTVSLSIEGDQVREWTVGSSTEQGSYREPDLGPGVYTATLEFHSNQYDIVQQRSFSLKLQDAEETCEVSGGQNAEIDTVALREPIDGIDFYKNVSGGTAQDFAYEVCGSKPGNVSLNIFDSTGSLTYIYNDEYNTGEEFKIYREALDTASLNTGQYTWNAEYENSDGTYTSPANRSFQIVDFTPPRTTNLKPDGKSFVQGKDIPISWKTESFDESLDIELVVRPKGQYSGTTEFTSAQAASKSKSYSTTISRTTGEYEYFIKMKTAGLTFESDVKSFRVVSEELDAANITLHKPRQDVKYKLGNKSEVPVKFNYSTQVYSKTDSNVQLQLWNVSEQAGQYEKIYSTSQVKADGEITTDHTKNLTEGGYRWRVVIEYPNGQQFNSTARSFAIGDVDVPSSEPAKGVIQDSFGFIGNLNKQVKGAAGSTGQFFIAVMITLIVSGILHLWWRMEYLTMAATLLIVLGFSLADGYFPIATFYILAAVSAAAAAYMGVQILGGDS